MADRPKASTPGEEDKKKYLGHEGRKFFKPVLKIAKSLLARIRRKILHGTPSKKSDKYPWDCVSQYQMLYTLSLSLNSKENERKEKKKDIYVHGLFNYYIFDTLKVYIIVVKDSCILMLPRGPSCYLWRLLRICYFMLPFQLLFA